MQANIQTQQVRRQERKKANSQNVCNQPSKKEGKQKYQVRAKKERQETKHWGHFFLSFFFQWLYSTVYTRWDKDSEQKESGTERRITVSLPPMVDS